MPSPSRSCNRSVAARSTPLDANLSPLASRNTGSSTCCSSVQPSTVVKLYVSPSNVAPSVAVMESAKSTLSMVPEGKQRSGVKVAASAALS